MIYKCKIGYVVSDRHEQPKMGICLTNPTKKSAKASSTLRNHCLKASATLMPGKTPSALLNAQPSLCQKMRIDRILTNVIAKNKLVHIQLKILRTHTVIRPINRAFHL